jgi:hypothetical protein
MRLEQPPRVPNPLFTPTNKSAEGRKQKEGWRRPFSSGLRQRTLRADESWLDYSPDQSYTCSMPVYRRYFAPGQLQFITTSTYRRVPVFLNPAHCQLFVDALRAVRSKLVFSLSVGC